MAPSMTESLPSEEAGQRKKSSGPVIIVMLLLSALYLSLALFSERLSFGSERDAYLVGISAQRLAHHQAWEPSRTPGFPVFERLVSWVFLPGDVRGGKVLVAFFSLGAIFIFLILGLRSGRNQHVVLLVAILFGLIPLWVQSSIIILDYSASIFFALAVGVLLERCPFRTARGAFLVAIATGIVLALGTGCRITTVLLLPAIALAVLFDKNKNTGIKASFISGVAIVTVAGSAFLYKPAFDRYGIDFLNTTHIPLALVADMKMVVYQLIRFWGGIAGCAVILVTIVIAFRNMRTRLIERLWTRQGPGIRSLFLYVFFNTACYLLNPEKVTYFLPLLIGIMLVFAISLEKRDRFILAGAVAVMALGSFVQIYPRGFHGVEMQRGQVLSEWRYQQMDRSLFNACQSLIMEPHPRTTLFGYPATDRIVVWFYDRIRVAEILPHPYGRTLWGTRTFYPDRVYELDSMLLIDPPLLLSGGTVAKLNILMNARGITNIIEVRSWMREPFEVPAALRQGKKCTELCY
jgi:hypothetical protein